MTLDEFIASFAEQFDDTDASEFHKDTRFQELEEWGSLVGMSVLAFVKTEMGKSVSGAEIRSCETIEDFYNLLASK